MLNKRIKYFIHVVEEGSFTATAKKMYLTQSAISQQIDLLERELGIKLFDRSGYRPKLTKAGVYYYDQCKQLMALYEETLIEMNRMKSEQASTLNVGITGPVEEKHLPQVVKYLREEIGDINLNAKKITLGSGVDYLKEGTIDAAFGITNDFIGEDEIEMVALFSHEVCVVCSKQHPWASLESIKGKDVEKEKLVVFSPRVGFKFFHDYIEAFRRDGVEPNIVKEVDDLDELLLSVRMNEGISLISREVINDYNNISVLSIEETNHCATYCIGYMKSNKSHLLREFVNGTISYFEMLNH